MQDATIHHANFSFKGRRVAFSAYDSSCISRLAAMLDLPSGERGSADCFIGLRQEASSFSVYTNRGCRCYDTLSGAFIALLQKIPAWLLPFRTNYVLHGGAIIADRKAHLFLGPGYIGKSTIAAEAWLMGYEVLGDDYLVLDVSTATVQAVPKPIKLRRFGDTISERLMHVLEPDSYCLGCVDSSWALVLSRGLRGMVPLHQKFPIGSIYLLERSNDDGVCCQPVDKYQFFRSSYDQLVASPRNNLDLLRCLSIIHSERRVFTLRVGPDAIASAIATMVERASAK